jgi:hypothetical protein
MTNSVRLLPSAAAILVATTLFAGPGRAEMPAVKISDANKVAACASPGRLMAFVKDRNPNLPDKFDNIAAAYKQAGEELGVRWDYAFFQMLVETGFLTYKGTVKPDQNNFAGIGATGGGVRGESFKDVVTGARAHLEHLAMYAGDKLENPTAERTRLVMEQGVLTSWQNSISGPMTYTRLTKKWAPTSKNYARDIQNVADRFFNGSCNGVDPTVEASAEVPAEKAPSKVAEASQPADEPAVDTTAVAATAPVASSAVPSASIQSAYVPPASEAVNIAVANGAQPPPVPVEESIGDKLAKKANDDARADVGVKSGLGGGQMAEAAATQQPQALKILNAPQPPAATAPTQAPAETAAVAPVSPAVAPKAEAAKPGLLASLSAFGRSIMNPATKSDVPNAPAAPADAAAPLANNKPAGNSKCRVFTASYGGGKSVIIKAVADKQTNYTVLDVNEGAEKREADAYIAAYAKGGETVGNDFKSQDQALDKAFELCPEG